MPTGLTLSSAGVLSGTPTAGGTFTFTITGSDSANPTHATGSQSYTVTVAAPTITLSPATLPSGAKGTAYSQTISASGGTSPYTFTRTSGTLPAGLTLSSAGVLSGTPTTLGTSSFTITATDSSTGTGPYTASQAYTLTISLALSPTTLPAPTVGTAYSQTVSASGGTSPYTFARTSGSLPAGLTLSSAGVLSGTPTAGGTFTFTITATDSATPTHNTGFRSYTVTVNAPTITLSPTTLPTPVLNTAYSQAVSASGGTSPYTFARTSGTLPTGLTLSSAGVLSGTPTAAGTSTFTITATDSSTGTGPYTASQSYTLTIPLALSPSTLPGAAVGTAYSQTVSTSGGTAPYTFAKTSGTLPAGLTLSSAGVLSGTPTAGGSFTFTITGTDSATPTPATGSQSYTLTVAAPTITLSPTTLPAPAVGSAYSQTVSASGGTAPYTFAKTSGTLPTGLTLSSAGVLSGTPTAGGSFTFTITGTDSSTGTGPYSASRSYTLTVAAPTITLSPTTLPAPAVGSAYSQTVSASGGTAPYTFAKTSGTLPTGLTLSSAGVLSGTPTAGGSFTFTITGTDSSTGTGPYTASQSYTVTVAAPTITLSPTTLPGGTKGTAYSQTVSASGGTSPYTFARTSGTLPTGLTLSSAGVLSGTPTAAGSYTFTITGTDSSTGTGPYTGSQAYTVTISLALSPTTLPAAAVGSAYSATTITATGGTSPYTYNVTSGALPAGLSLTSAGVLSGTPTAGGSFTFTVTATDSTTPTHNTGSQSYTLTVAAPTILVSPTTLPGGTKGTAYSQPVVASGGTAPYTFAKTSGTLPTGLTLSSAGVLSGTPTAAGSYTFTITGTDSSTGTGPYTGSQSYTVSISLALSPTTLPGAAVGSAYSQTVVASGGTAPYTYTVTSGALPAGLSLTSAGVLSGTPTAGGSFTFTITGTDSATPTHNTGSQSYTLTVAAPTITLSPTTLPAPAVGSAYSQTVSASGGTAPYTFAKTSGTLPTGLTLSSAGVLSGTPTAGGSFTFTITGTDSSTGTGPYTASQSYTVTVAAPTITLSPTTLPGGTKGTAYSQTVSASGGTSPYTFARTSGTLPTGLTLSSAGVLSGTPTAAGSYTFTITGTDSSTGTGPYTGSQAYTVTISLALSPTTLPAAAVGSAYSATTITATGGTSPYTYNVTSGALPAGLSLTSAGVLSGTPTAGGSFTFTVTATDSTTPTHNTGSQSYTLTVAAPTILVSPTTLPGGTKGTAYSQPVVASGGTAPYTFAKTSGTLPTGLTLSSAGVLSGTPTAAGSYTFTITGTDSSTGTGPYTGSQSYTVSISLALSPTTLPGAAVGSAYSQTVVASGGTAPYTYTVTSGALPAGLSLTSAGVLSGTPTAGGSFTFTITGTDSATPTHNTGSQSYTLTVAAPTITLSPTTLPAPAVGSAYSQTVSASGGTAPYTFAKTSGTLPTGLTLSSAGVLSGTPTAGGSFTFTITGTDSSTGTGPYTASQSYTVTVAAPTITLSPTTLPGGTKGTAYSQTVSASGGTSPYTFARTSGTLPTGLTLSSAGVLSGTPTAAGSYTFTITGTDSSTGTGPYTGSQAYTVTISLALSPTTLPAAAVGSAYSATTITATGGTSPYTYNVTSGALPAGLSLTSAGVLSGTPTAGGSFTFTVTATDSTTPTHNTGSQSYTLTVAAPTILVSPTTLPGGTKGTAYSQPVVASGGTAPYTFAKTSGTLPTGLTLSSAGVLSGTPTAAGSYTFTITGTDSSTGTGPYTGSQSYTVSISLALSPTTLPGAAVGSAYSQTVVASGGTAPYTYTVTSGALPAGLSLTSAGVLSGTPTAGGSFTFTITGTDSATPTHNTGSQSYTLTVAAPTITLSPTTLPAPAVGTAYSQTVSASGGTAPYTFAKTSGTLPTGLTLSSGGVLSGTPTAGGSFTFTITGTDSSTGTGPYTASQSYTVTVAAPTITLSPTTLPGGTKGTAYSQTVSASGGTSPYTFARTSGTLPTGLTLSSAGVLSGTPTAAGTYTFTITGTDSSTGTGPYTGSQSYTVTISLALSPTTLPAAAVGTAYSQTVSASGGTSPYTFARTSGTLPAGLTLSSAGVLSGTPTAGGSFTFTITATDSATPTHNTGSQSYTLTVSAPTILVSPTTLPAATWRSSYSHTLSASGGTSPYTYSRHQRHAADGSEPLERRCALGHAGGYRDVHLHHHGHRLLDGDRSLHRVPGLHVDGELMSSDERARQIARVESGEGPPPDADGAVARRISRTGDETGATLVLALLFLVVIGLLVGGLASWTANDLSNEVVFQNPRSAEFALNSATQLAIQNIRYAPLITPNAVLGTDETLNASPPEYCWGSGPTASNPNASVGAHDPGLHGRRLLQHVVEPRARDDTSGHHFGLSDFVQRHDQRFELANSVKLLCRESWPPNRSDLRRLLVQFELVESLHVDVWGQYDHKQFESGGGSSHRDGSCSHIGTSHGRDGIDDHRIRVRERIDHGLLRRPGGSEQCGHHDPTGQRDVQFCEFDLGHDAGGDNRGELLRGGLDPAGQQSRRTHVRVSAGDPAGHRYLAEFGVGERRDGSDHQRDRFPFQRLWRYHDGELHEYGGPELYRLIGLSPCAGPVGQFVRHRHHGHVARNHLRHDVRRDGDYQTGWHEPPDLCVHLSAVLPGGRLHHAGLRRQHNGGHDHRPWLLERRDDRKSHSDW